MAIPAFVKVTTGRERHGPGLHLGRHVHATAYAAVILSGGYEEAGCAGRARVHAGDVLLHGPFDGHLDRFAHGATEILNIALPGWRPDRECLGRISDPDSVVRAAERDPRQGAHALFEQWRDGASNVRDWPDALRDHLAASAGNLTQWARTNGLAPETLSRAFGRLYGIAPAAFRAEMRARRAWWRIVDSAAPLATIAAETGFADQAHMTRAVAALTGASPGRWRRSNPFKTAPA